MNHSLRHGVTKRLLKKFLNHILIYSLCILCVFAVGYLLCEKIVWYDTDPFYPLIHILHQNWLSFLLFTLLFGCVTIVCVHFYAIAKMMEQVTQAVDDMYTNRVNSILLPDTLREVEMKMNQIMVNVRQSEQNAREAEQRKNEMIVYMAHDLKTPLTSVIGYLTLLKDEPNITRQLHQKYLDITWNKACRLEELVNEFFDVTRYNFSSLTLEYSTVNMTMMVEQILYEFKPLFQTKGIRYTLNAEPNITVACDIDRMERVFDNLFKNAINYSYDNTEILVVLKPSGTKGMEMTVQNHGKTIPKEKQEAIFEQFFRMDSSRASQTGGTGLGLAIARQIVELHHGQIWCESENETITFHLTL